MSTSRSKSSKGKEHLRHDLVTALTQHLKLNDTVTLARLRASSKHVNDTFDKPIKVTLLQLIERAHHYAMKHSEFGYVAFRWEDDDFDCTLTVRTTHFIIDVRYSPKYPRRTFKDRQKQYEYDDEQEELAAKAMNDILDNIFTNADRRPRATIYRSSIRSDWETPYVLRNNSAVFVENNDKHVTQYIQYLLREIIGSDNLPTVEGSVGLTPTDKGKLTRLWKSSIFYTGSRKSPSELPHDLVQALMERVQITDPKIAAALVATTKQAQHTLKKPIRLSFPQFLVYIQPLVRSHKDEAIQLEWQLRKGGYLKMRVVHNEGNSEQEYFAFDIQLGRHATKTEEAKRVNAFILENFTDKNEDLPLFSESEARLNFIVEFQITGNKVTFLPRSSAKKEHYHNIEHIMKLVEFIFENYGTQQPPTLFDSSIVWNKLNKDKVMRLLEATDLYSRPFMLKTHRQQSTATRNGGSQILTTQNNRNASSSNSSGGKKPQQRLKERAKEKIPK